MHIFSIDRHCLPQQWLYQSILNSSTNIIVLHELRTTKASVLLAMFNLDFFDLE